MEEIFWPALLLFFGLALLVAELFLPTGGVLGLAAMVCLSGSGYLAYLISSSTGHRWAICEVGLVAAAWTGSIYGLPRTRFGRRVYLQPPNGDDLDAPESLIRTASQLGRSGRVLTPLRPSGTIEVDGRRVEAMAELGLINSGAMVTVIAVRSGRAIVREI